MLLQKEQRAIQAIVVDVLVLVEALGPIVGGRSWAFKLWVLMGQVSLETTRAVAARAVVLLVTVNLITKDAEL